MSTASAIIRTARRGRDELHALALVDLMSAASSDAVVERSIEALRAAAGSARNPTPILVDLSAAYITHAESTQRVRDLLEAVEAADSAVALEPHNPAALFNLALALDRLGLEDQARQAWGRYLQVDSTSGWGLEAAQRRSTLAAQTAVPPLAMNLSLPAADSFAVRAPQLAREQGWERVLDEWAGAVLRGDSARAVQRLALAEALGTSLAHNGGDGTLAQAVAAIRSASRSGPALRLLAEAHQAYAAGQHAYVVPDHAEAEKQFSRVQALGQASPSLMLWAGVFRGANLAYLKKPAAADSLLRWVVIHADTSAAPAAAGRVHWIVGTMLLRVGEYQKSVAEYRMASRLLHRAGEGENIGAVDYGLGEAEFALGNEAAADSILMHGLTTLRSERTSRWLHTLMFVVANVSTAARVRRAEGYVRAEDVAVAEGTGNLLYISEAYAARARFLARSGVTAPGTGELERIRRRIPEIPDSSVRARAENDLRLAEAEQRLRSSPAAAMAGLDSSVVYYRSAANILLLIPALQGRAEARLALRDADGGAADLDEAGSQLARLNTKIDQTAARVAMLERASRLFDRLAMLRLAQGRNDLAFAAVERGRVVVFRRETSAPPPARPASRRGEVLVSFALVGDTLLAWTLAGTTLHVERSTPGRERLLRTLNRVRAALEGGASEEAVRGDLSTLYALLVRPVEARLGARVVVLADGEIASAPFAALFDAPRGRYLVEDRELRFAASLRDAAAAGPAHSAAGPALLVADPAFDPRRFPGLHRLAGARAEVDSIAPGFRGATVLEGMGATSVALLDALPRTGLLHFAGHAVFDDERPERSYLLLSPSGHDDGRLTAARLDSLPLSGMRLVVLSACRTTPGRSGRSGGFVGLSGALMNAGAQGVVGSLWEMDDTWTVPLMTSFHRAYRETGDGAASLRAAQRAMLGSSDPALRSPAAWAGFRYAGR